MPRGERAWDAIRQRYGDAVVQRLAAGETITMHASNGLTYQLEIRFSRLCGNDLRFYCLDTFQSYCIHMDVGGYDEADEVYHIADRVLTIMETVRVAPDRIEEATSGPTHRWIDERIAPNDMAMGALLGEQLGDVLGAHLNIRATLILDGIEITPEMAEVGMRLLLGIRG